MEKGAVDLDQALDCEYVITFAEGSSAISRGLVENKIATSGFFVSQQVVEHEHCLVVTAPLRLYLKEAEKIELDKPFSLEDEEVPMPLSAAKIALFKGADTIETFFTPAQKAMLLRLALLEVTVGVGELQETGVKLDLKKVHTQEGDQLNLMSISQHCSPKIVEEFFPRHEAQPRKELWNLVKSRPFSTPIQHMRNYFGEEVTFYFAWMDFFAQTLALPGVVGLYMYLSRPKGMDIDHAWRLPIFAGLVLVWAILFLAFWRRRQASLSCLWETSDFERVAEVRPEFFGEIRPSPVTGRPEIYYPSWKRCLRYAVSFLAAAPLLALGLGAMLLSLNLNGYIKDHHSPFYVHALCQYAEPGGIFAQDNPYYGWIVPTLMHSVVIFFLNSQYRHVASWCTDFENHRTVAEWNNSLITKRFLFEAFDCYTPLFYIAFYRLDINSLRSELVGLFWGDELRRLVTEVFIPLISSRLKTRSLEKEYSQQKKTDETHKAEASDLYKDVVLDEYEEFDDFLEMVVQFGYITLFASAMPLCSAISLLFLLIELKADCLKLLFVYKRPHARRAADIGVWMRVMVVMTIVAIISNVCLIGFSSEQLETWMPELYEWRDNDHFIKPGSGRYVVAIVFILEHIMLVFMALALTFIPPQPADVTNSLLRKDHLRKLVELSPRWISGSSPAN